MIKSKTTRDIDIPAHGEYHTFIRDSRKAVVHRNTNGFYVNLYEDNILKEKRNAYEHSEQWAEDIAENWVDGIIT